MANLNSERVTPCHSRSSDGTLKIKRVDSPEQLEAVFPIVRELRPHLTFELFSSLVAEAAGRDDYQLLGWFNERGDCVGAIGYRLLFDLAHGRHLYVDDLVFTARHRSNGLGAKMLA